MPFDGGREGSAGPTRGGPLCLGNACVKFNQIGALTSSVQALGHKKRISQK